MERQGAAGLMRIGVDLDDVTAVCAVPFLRTFAAEFGLQLPAEDVGWHTLRDITAVSGEDKDRFRIRLYDGPFFSQLEVYGDAPNVLERMVGAGHELFYITARAEKQRYVTETWLREKGLMEHAKAVHLRPRRDFDPSNPPGRYDASSSARYKVRLADELGLEAFCEDDEVIGRALAESGIHVWLFDQPWNRDLAHANIERVAGWGDVARALALSSGDGPLR